MNAYIKKKIIIIILIYSKQMKACPKMFSVQFPKYAFVKFRISLTFIYTINHQNIYIKTLYPFF